MPVVQAQDGAAALFQLVVMTLGGHLFLGVVGSVKAECFQAHSGEPQFFVFQNHIVAAAVGTVLLGTDVIFVQALNSGVVDAMGGGVTLVGVVLSGAEAIVGNLLQRIGNEQTQTKPGQFRELHVPLCQNVGGDCAGNGYRPVYLDIHEPLNRDSCDGDIGVDANLAVCCQAAGHVGAGDSSIVVGSHPFQLLLPVVVSGSTPDVEIHGLIQQFLAFKDHGAESAHGLVVAVGEVLAGDNDVALFFHYFQVCFGQVFLIPDGQSLLVSAVYCGFQGNLIEAQFKACGKQFGGFFQLVNELQVSTALRRNGDVQADCAFGVGQDCGNPIHLTALNYFTVAVDFIANGQILVHGHEVHVVVECHNTGFLIELLDTDRAVHILVLHHAGMGAAVGIHKTVHTEVAIVGILAVVTTVPVHRLAVWSLALVDGVVTPLPDEAAAHDLVGLNELPVVFQIAGAVAHGVGVFAHQVGLIGIAVYILLQSLQRGIHVGVQVDVREVVLALSAAVLGTFVVGQTGGVEMLGPCQRRFETAAVGTFVTHGPADDAGTVLIPDDTPLGAVQGCFQEVGVVGKGLVPMLHMVLPQLIFGAVHLSRAVALVVGFVDDHEAVLVTELIEHGGVGIVGGANSIEVILLDHLQVPLHMLQGDHGAGDGVGVVPVNATELDGVAV